MEESYDSVMDGDKGSGKNGDKMFTLKKWNAVAMWSWDVECDTCAICRVQVMGKTVYLFIKFIYSSKKSCPQLGLESAKLKRRPTR